MSYSQLFKIPDPHATGVSIPATGDGYSMPIITERTLPGGILPDVDFITRFSGFIQAIPNSASDGTFNFQWRFRHWYDTPRQFTATRNYIVYLGHQFSFSIGLSVFDSVVRISIGDQIPLDNGGMHTVTEADLRNEMNIKAEVLVTAYELPPSTVRRAATLSSLHIHGGSINFVQPPQPQDSSISGRTTIGAIFSLAEFRRRFPEFASKPDSDVEPALEIAARINRNAVGLWVAAHIVAIGPASAGADGGQYPVEMEKLGPSQTQYAVPADRDDLRSWLRITQYGRRYLAMTHSGARSGIGARVVG